jgi:hypothetical protein
MSLLDALLLESYGLNVWIAAHGYGLGRKMLLADVL